MSFHIQASTESAVVTLAVEGRFDLSIGFALWQYCRPEERRYHGYIIDLAQVSDLRDSGLSWLLMFTRWAKGSGVRVRVVNVSPEDRQRCAELGIPVYAPGDHPVRHFQITPDSAVQAHE